MSNGGDFHRCAAHQGLFLVAECATAYGGQCSVAWHGSAGCHVGSPAVLGWAGRWRRWRHLVAGISARHHQPSPAQPSPALPCTQEAEVCFGVLGSVSRWGPSQIVGPRCTRPNHKLSTVVKIFFWGVRKKYSAAPQKYFSPWRSDVCNSFS